MDLEVVKREQHKNFKALAVQAWEGKVTYRAAKFPGGSSEDCASAGDAL